MLAAFFDPADLAVWWEASRAVTLPCLLGPYAVQWPPTEFEDEVLGKLDLKMTSAFHAVNDVATRQKLFMRDAAYVVAINRVATVTRMRGMYA